MKALTRREFVMTIAGVHGGLAWAGSPLERLASGFPSAVANRVTHRYRADATVTFLGIPIFSRSGVGSCSIAFEQSASAEAHMVALRFEAGSAPERTRGLNRLGYIQEVIVERGADVAESAYFGFMTSSTEESFEQAKAALGANAKDGVPYTAVEGSATARSNAYQLFQMKLPSSYNFSKCDEVVRRVKELLAKNEIPVAKQENVKADYTARTFLYAVRAAMRDTGSKVAAPFLYNGKRYRLEIEKIADRKMGQQFATRKLAAGNRVYRMNGSIQNVASKQKTPFKLWFEQGYDFPLRFEYKAKSYLNLVFERV